MARASGVVIQANPGDVVVVAGGILRPDGNKQSVTYCKFAGLEYSEGAEVQGKTCRSGAWV